MSLGPAEHKKVQEALQFVCTSRNRISKEDKQAALEQIDEFIRTYPLRENHQSYYYCHNAYQKLINMGLIKEED